MKWIAGRTTEIRNMMLVLKIAGNPIGVEIASEMAEKIIATIRVARGMIGTGNADRTIGTRVTATRPVGGGAGRS